MRFALRRIVQCVALAVAITGAEVGCGKGPDVGGCSGTTPENTDGTTASSHFLFPINSGSHAGLACDTCHGGAPDWVTINCVCCHSHSQSLTDPLHTPANAPGYQYTSQKCFECHTNG
jgi:hypothetical protein